jgi:hypothetical protein
MEDGVNTRGPGTGLALTVSVAVCPPPPVTTKEADPELSGLTVIVLPEMDGLTIPAGVESPSVHGPDQ